MTKYGCRNDSARQLASARHLKVETCSDLCSPVRHPFIGVARWQAESRRRRTDVFSDRHRGGGRFFGGVGTSPRSFDGRRCAQAVFGGTSAPGGFSVRRAIFLPVASAARDTVRSGYSRRHRPYGCSGVEHACATQRMRHDECHAARLDPYQQVQTFARTPHQEFDCQLTFRRGGFPPWTRKRR